MSSAEARIFAKAAKSVALLSERRRLTFEEWIDIARGLTAIRDRVLAETGASSASSRTFSKALPEFAAKHPWAARWQGEGRSSFRSAAYFMVERLDEINEWRATLSEREREELANPEVVRRRFLAARDGSEPRETIGDLRRENARLRAALAKAKREAK